MTGPVAPNWDRGMRQRLARGEEAALGELYDGFASLVHGLAHRVMGDDAAADQITREVFGYIWENPDAYDPERGNLRSWIAELTQRQAVHWLRRSEADRVRAGGQRSAELLEARVREAEAAARADFIRSFMPAPLRTALELTYRDHHDYRKTAAEMGLTPDETRRRLRLGLQMLSTARRPRPGGPGAPGSPGGGEGW